VSGCGTDSSRGSPEGHYSTPTHLGDAAACRRCPFLRIGRAEERL